MEYMSAPQAARKWGISERQVQILCSENRVPDVSKRGCMWLIPKAAQKPENKRYKKINLHNRFKLPCYNLQLGGTL